MKTRYAAALMIAGAVLVGALENPAYSQSSNGEMVFKNAGYLLMGHDTCGVELNSKGAEMILKIMDAAEQYREGWNLIGHGFLAFKRHASSAGLEQACAEMVVNFESFF